MTKEKRGCSPALWVRTVNEICAAHDTNPVHVLSGSRGFKFVAVRWEAWRRLAAMNISYSSLGQVSGFDHTTVRYGCRDDVRTTHLEKFKRRYRQKCPTEYLAP
jgi:hypothetical protein